MPAPRQPLSWHVGLLVALDDQVLDPHALGVVRTDHRKDGRRFGLAIHHAVGHQRLADREGIAVLPGDPGDSRVKAAGVLVPDRDAAACGESVRVLHGDLLLSEIAVNGQGRNGSSGFSQNGLAFDAPHGDVRPQVQRIAHQVLALADLDRAASEPRHVIHGRLQDPVVAADHVRILLSPR